MFKQCPQQQSMFMFPASELEIRKIISKFDTNKATGHDELPATIIKASVDVIAPYLLYIVNVALSTGVFPKNLKVAKVIPLFKKGDRHGPSNYRPISILTAVSKLYERIIYR